MPALFRGFSQKLATPEQSNIFYHTPRVPKNTDLRAHKIADQWFFETFGVYARSSTLICSTDFSQANSYGAVYRIYPNAPAAIIYSPSVKDFHELESDLDEHTESSVIEWLIEKDFKMVSGCEDIDSKFWGEVMVICETYTALPRT